MLKAIIATLVLGASSVAVAAPSITFRGEARWGQPDTRPAARWRNNTWVALTSPLQLDRGRTMIDVNQRRSFQQLRLQQTTHGMTHIDRVVVRFENGQQQVINVNQRLSTRNPMVNINLDGRQRRVDRIIVTGDSRRGGAIQVFGI